MESLTELFNRSGLEVLSISEEAGSLVVNSRSSAEIAVCPHCGTESRRDHSRYLRTLKDLPAVGTRLVMRLTVRKFFCDHCRRRERQRIFSEQFRGLALRGESRDRD